MENKSILPKILLGAYLIFFAVLAINPVQRDVWWVENLTIIPIVVFLVILYIKGIRFSNLSYILMSFLIFMHTFGGHYTFAKVPFDWVTNTFGFERNMYDRIAHFTVGFYAFPVMEFLEKRNLTNKKIVAFLFALFSIISLAAVYELFEWQFAVSVDPAAGIEVLGSQGDIWDAQKDMLADTMGAITALLVYIAFRKKEQNLISN